MVVIAMAFAVIAPMFVPRVARAEAAPPVSDCQTNDGTAGVRVSLAVGGKTCFPLNKQGFQANPIFIYTTSILKIVAGLAGVATVGGFLWGGLLYITARANAGQVENAKMVMINSVIGLLMFIFMYAILQYLVPGGIFL